MVGNEFSFERDVLPVVREFAQARFARRHNVRELVDDSISVAWEGWRAAGPKVGPRNIAWYAVLGVAAGKPFRPTKLSADSPARLRAEGAGPVEALPLIGPEALARIGDDPAEWAIVRIDFAQWIDSLPAMKREVLIGLLLGETTGELARQLQVSAGRISQMRVELVECWVRFTA